MKGNFILLTALALTCLSARTVPSQQARNSIVRTAIYSGTTPCSKGKNLLPIVPAKDDCEHMKWRVTLFFTDSNLPSTYELSCEYGGPDSYSRGYKSAEMKGKWTISKGMKTNSNALVYELTVDGGADVLLVKISDDLLHLLDKDRRLMIGNPGWSYTLNRVKN